MLPLIDYDRAHQRNNWIYVAHTKSSSLLATDTQIQQGFIDERAPLSPTTVDPSRSAGEGEDEDEQNDEMSESIQTKQTEKRKGFQTDETARELRALLPITDSSHASPLRLSGRMQEQPERSSKQPRTARTGVEVLQDVSYMFQKEHCAHQRHGFLQLRIAGVRKSNKKVLKQKDGERNLHFPSCTLDVQAALRETRRIEWNKWMKFNTHQEVRQLTEAGCEIYPMKPKRISTKMTIMSLFPQSTRVCLAVETSRRQCSDVFQRGRLVVWLSPRGS